jgi:hypothetical protein
MINEGMTKFLAARSGARGAQGDTDCPKAPHTITRLTGTATGSRFPRRRIGREGWDY